MANDDLSALRSSLRHQVATDGSWDNVAAGPDDVLEVEVTTKKDRLEDAITAVKDAGGSVTASYGDTILADIPAAGVTSVSESDAVLLVGEHIGPKEHDVAGEFISEGVGITRADELHAEGITGENATIAVLDSEFDVNNEKYAEQVVGTIGPSGYFESPGAHGDACAEVVADMAPDADLVLGTVFGQDIFTTMNTLENDFPEVDVATMSVGYYPTRIDGRDSYSQRIEAFTDENRLFTTSAGNESGVKNAWQWDDANDQAVPVPQLSGTTWNGEFTDTSGNGIMEFDSRLSTPERLPIGTPLSDSDLDGMAADAAVGWLAIHWDEPWEDDNERYEVKLYANENDSTPVDTSLTAAPFEELVPQAQHFDSGDDYVYIEIESDGASGDNHFDVWTWGDLQVDYLFNTSSEEPLYSNDRCIGVPATSRDDDTLSIAAVQAVDLETTGLAFEQNKGDLKGYSSQGPTQYGRQGVQLAGPSHVSTLQRGPVEDTFGFNGTSAAAPHVGGGVALMAELEGVTLEDIKTSMIETGTGIPDPDVSGPPNTKIGGGYLDVYAAAQQTEGTYSLSVDNSVDVPDRTVIVDDPDIGEIQDTITGIGRLQPGETITVNVDANPTSEYQLELMDRELNTVATSSVLMGDAVETFDTTGYDPGSYVVSVMENGDAKAVFPVVLEAYDVTVTSAPSTITTDQTLTVQADLDTIDGSESIDRVMFAAMSDDSSTGASTTMTEVDTTNDVYEASISGLDGGEYDMAVAVQGTEQLQLNVEGMNVEENFTTTESGDLDDPETDISDFVNDNANEIIGMSDVYDLTVEIAAGSELAQKWSVARSNRLQFSTPALDNEFAYLGGLDDVIEARWRNSGDQKWSVSRDGALSDSSPILHDGMVLIGSGGGMFYGLDAADGSQQFVVDAGSAITSTPVVMDGTVYFGSNDGFVHAVDLAGASGSVTPKWSTDVGGSVYTRLAAGSNLIFVTTNNNDLVALNPDGSEAWNVNEGTNFLASSPNYVNGSLYVAGQSVYKLNPNDGTIQWEQNNFSGTAGANPEVYQGVVYVGADDGTLHALNDADGGTELWSTQTGGAIAANPTVVGDRVVAGSIDGSIYVMDRTTGTVVASKDLGEEIRSSPVVRDDEVYFGTDAGNVYVLKTIP